MARLTKNHLTWSILLIVGIGVAGYFGWNLYAKKLGIDAIMQKIPYITSQNQDTDICVNVDENAQSGGLMIRCFKPTEYAQYLATLPDAKERIDELAS